MEEIIHRGNCILTKWWNARQIEERSSSRQQSHQDRLSWQRPPNSFVKCDDDTSFTEYHNTLGVGINVSKK